LLSAEVQFQTHISETSDAQLPPMLMFKREMNSSEDQVRPSGVQGASVFLSSSQREMELVLLAGFEALSVVAVVAWAFWGV